ncbi:hypothetical protein KUV22_17100 [Microbulbifer agarilyticus]|uniref:hypothetical protein n=1 Tax=Microbulbifer agarilyticus TaxID=260552 RepID=UPI001C981B21|nr:hypothetical protein [Microbulbifer agarilyticus]MBY6192142.1 hypothetical protein [Microbulbifer agarilyticus]
MRKIIKLSLTGLLLSAAQAFAGACDSAPKSSVTQIAGAPVERWAKVECSKYGHIITFTENYGFILIPERRPIIYPAQLVTNEKPSLGPDQYYFTSISVDELSGSANEFLHGLHQKNIFGSIGQDVPEAKPKIWELSATTNENKDLALYFYEYPDIVVGTSCWESCAPTKGFVVARKPK